MMNIRSEPIVAVGAIISKIPLVDRIPKDLLQINDGLRIVVDADLELVQVIERL